MNYSQECPTCGEIMPRPNHKCPPAWLVRNTIDDESEACTIYDQTAPGAAEKFCLKMDAGESKPRDRKVTVERKVSVWQQRVGPSHYDMQAKIVVQYLPAMIKQPPPMNIPLEDEWAVGMPAYWLKLVDQQQLLTAEEKTRFYYIKPGQAIANVGYDQRLIVRVGGTEQAVRAVVDFVMHYVRSMEIRSKKVHTVQERFVRGWELAGKPGMP